MRDLDLVSTFLEVYRAGSVTAAAHRLGMSQPAVSERLGRLERQVGTDLFVRSPRGVTPTPAGERFAAEVGAPVDSLRAAMRSVVGEPAAAGRVRATGTVRVGGAADVVASRIVPALAPLTPEITLVVSLGLAPDLLHRLTEDELDVVVSSIRPTGPRIRSRGLIDEEFALVGSPATARALDPVRLASDPATELGALPLVAYDEQLSIVRRYWRSQFGRRPTNPVTLVVPDLRAVLAGVTAGAGISAIPRYLADPAVAAGTVELLHRPVEATINTLHLAIPAWRPPSPATSAVLTRLLERAAVWDSF